jgi:uncharacterized protein YxeA
MTASQLRLAGLALVITALWGGGVSADETDVPLDKLPKEVMKAANDAVPKAKWTGAVRSEEDKTVTYELEGTDAKGRYVWVELTDKGVVNEVQTEVKYADSPKEVREALEKKFPRFKVETTYMVEEKGKVTRYDFEGKRPRDKEEITITVSADGKTVEVYDE